MKTAKRRERRRQPRLSLPGSTRARVERDVVEGVVQDVSTGGIAVRTNSVLEMGQEVNLEIEGISTVAGRVVRVFDGGFVVSLDMEAEARDRFFEDVDRIRREFCPDGE